MLEWDGVTKSESINSERNMHLQRLFEDAKVNMWENIFSILKNNRSLINSVQPESHNGYTLLHYAALNSNFTAIPELLKLGAIKGIKCADGRQPFELLQYRPENAAI